MTPLGFGAAPIGFLQTDQDRVAGILNLLLDEQQRAFNARQVGRTLDVLFERPGRNPGQIVGRSPYLQAVHALGTPDLIGRIVPVTIESAAKMSLAGRLETVLEPV